MRWFVEVTSGEKTDLQKYVVEAESWQRALQAARAQRGEQGPMSGFSIELLDEGYRAVDPVARNRFVVKRAPDDAPLSIAPPAPPAPNSKAPAAPKGFASKAPAPLPSASKASMAAVGKSIPPAAGAAKSIPPAAGAAKSIPPAAASSSKSIPPAAASSSKSIPPRPGDSSKTADAKKSRAERKSEKLKAAALKKEARKSRPALESIDPEALEDIEDEAPKTESQPEPPVAAAAPPVPEARPKDESIPDAPLLPVGAFVPGLPSVKTLASREQEPSDASPLAYREYAFAVKAGTTEEVAEKVLRAQLNIVQAHLAKLKQGKLVNLAVFDMEFTGKPPGPPVATLAWKDWKGDPVLAFPRRGGAGAVVKPPAAPAPAAPTPSVAPPAPAAPAASVVPVSAAPATQPTPNAPPHPAPAVNMPPGYSAPPPPMNETQPIQPSALPRPANALAAMVGAAQVGSEPKVAAENIEPVTTPNAPAFQPPPNLGATVKDAVNPFGAPPASTQNPFAKAPSAPPAAPGPGTSPMIPVAAPVSPPPEPVAASPAPAPVAAHSVPPPAANPFAQAPSNNVFSAGGSGSIPPPPAAIAQSFPPPAFPAAVASPAPVPSAPPPAPAVAAPTPSVPPPAVLPSVPPGGFNPVVVNQIPAPAAVPHTPSSPPSARRSSPSYHPDGSVRTPSGRFVRGRVTGDELITQLFESMHDLHFLRDALDGGQFCLALAMEMIPVRAALIHFFDVEKRQWIVACTRGKDAQKLLTTNTPETDDLLRAAARHRRAIVTPNAAQAQAARYQTLGGAKSIIIAPIMQAGRALGAIEIVNPMDSLPFNEDEGNAMTYIAEQYAEYLGSRGIVVNIDRIRAAAANAASIPPGAS